MHNRVKSLSASVSLSFPLSLIQMWCAHKFQFNETTRTTTDTVNWNKKNAVKMCKQNERAHDKFIGKLNDYS